jgi:peptidoglycan/xylan/chitin deacetylase (PgdA/CDA1 family)
MSMRDRLSIAARALLRTAAPMLAGALCLTIPAFAQQQPATVAAPAGTAFTTLGFHEVVDARGELDDDAVTTDRLVSFFDWLRGNGWTAVSLDDIARARRGEKPLPDKAVLITFDDGYRSLYTRVFPLALAYGFPIVAALVGDWMNAPAGATVRYGDRAVPREHFITWDQAREMQRSGLVEFALHTQGLHTEVLANPQGNTMPAAITRRYTPGVGYQSGEDLAAAVRADLERERATFRRELRRAPRAVVWPYGRYNEANTQRVLDLGFEFALTLDVGPSIAGHPARLARYLPTYNPPLQDLARNMRPDPNEMRVDRLVCLDPAVLWDQDAETANARLGRAIERARVLGVSGLVVDAVRRDAQGRITAAWFPTRELPLAGDWLSRIAWQMRTRAGVSVYVRLPHAAALAALGDKARVVRLYQDLGALVPLDGWMLEDTEAPAQPLRFADPQPLYAHRAGTPPSWAPWVVRARRDSVLRTLIDADSPEALGWQAFDALDAARPGLELLWLAPKAAVAAPHPLADISLVPARLSDPVADGRVARVEPLLARWFTGPVPPDAQELARVAIDFERHGGVSLGWCPDDPLADRPAAAVAGPGVSAATFPLRR